MLKKFESGNPVTQWAKATMMFSLLMLVIASVVVRNMKPSAAMDVDVLREAREWAREAGYSTLSTNCLEPNGGMYTQCSVFIVEKEDPINLSCNNLTGTCERVQ